MRKKINLRRVLFVLGIIYVSYVLISTQITINKIKTSINTKQEELARLEDKNRKLQDEIDMSKTDAYIEKLAREKLHMIKQGETPVISNNKK